MTINDFVIKESIKIVDELCSRGYIQGGENGPYFDHETPVRITSHWIIIFTWLYKEKRQDDYLCVIKQLADFLVAQEIENTYNSFYCRRKRGKDHVNGTIGQAWAIEGLVEAAKLLKDKQYYDIAVKVFLNHPFNEKIGLWNRYEVNGRKKGYDETFNHQLWLAASGAEIISLYDNPTIRKQITLFLDKCMDDSVFHIHEDGVICHYACVSDTMKHRLRFIKMSLKQRYLELMNKPNIRYKEEGYHYFSLYGFALLKDEFGNHPLFASDKLRKSVDYALDFSNLDRLISVEGSRDGTGLASKIGFATNKVNIYGFPYNSPAFELPYIIKKFKPELFNRELVENLWKRQTDITMDDNGQLKRNTVDPRTLTSRIYELTRALSED